MRMFKRKESLITQLIKGIIDKNPAPWSDEIKKELKKEFKKLTESLVITSRSEAEKFDKGILSLSSIFLGFTLTFVDKIVSLNTAWYKWLLCLSWVAFLFSIVTILFGLLMSQKSIRQMIEEARKYLIEGNLNYSNFAENTLNKVANISNYISLFLFVSGAATFVLFVILNVTRL
jgi:hypothetical protein